MNAQTIPTHRFAIGILRNLLANSTESAAALLTRDDLDKAELCALFEKSKLAGYVYTQLVDTPLSDCFEPEEFQLLANAYTRQFERIERSQSLHAALMQALGSADIPFLTLKGLYLSQRFFGNVKRRFMWDADILVHPGDLQRTLDTVQEIGLQLRPGVGFDPRHTIWGIHAVEVRGDLGILDIHYTIRNIPGVNFDIESMWRNAQEFRVGARAFRTLSDADTLLIAAVGLGGDLQTSNHNLRKIWDVYMIMRKLDAVTDWQAFFAQREREHCLKLVLNVFSFCLNLLEAERDCPEICREMSRHAKLLHIHNQAGADRIFLRPKQNLANRLLYSRLLPISPLQYWLRWFVTLPVRVWHYRN